MKTLIAVGSSKHATEAIVTGVEFAKATNSSVTILHVIKDPGNRAEAQEIINRATRLAQRQYADNGSTPSAGQIEGRIRLGHPAEEIVAEAAEGGYNLIVVGTWPKLNLLHRLLAPTTERVVTQAHCPVLVAKGELDSLQHVLLCVSGADSPSRAAQFVCAMSDEMEAELDVTVLHVMSQISASLEVRDDWQLDASAEKLIREGTPEGKWLRRDVETLKRAKARVQPKVRHGLVVDEVLMETLESECDLVVIGAHRQEGWQRILLDDLAYQIVVRADRPVLIA